MSELDALVEEAWGADAGAVKKLWKTARRHPELARTAWTVEWVRTKRYEGGGAAQNLLEVAALALAIHGDPRVVPFLVPRAFERWDFARLLLPWLETERIDRARLAKAVRPFIHADDAGPHDWVLAARCLAHVGDEGDREIVAARLGACFDKMWSTNASMPVRLEPHAARLGAALLRLGVPRSFTPMLEAVVSTEQRAIDRARGTAALLLASIGAGLDAVARGLREELDRGRGGRVTAGQLLALGALGKSLPEEARAGLAALVRRAHEARSERAKHDEVAVAAQAALTDLGSAADLPAAARACLATTHDGWDDTVRAWVFVLDLVRVRPDLPADLATPLVHDGDMRLHRAAFRALRARGAPVPETSLADPWWAAHAPIEAVRAALTDERTLWLVPVAQRLVDAPDREATGALLTALERLPAPRSRDRSDPRSHARRQLCRALVAAGAPEGLAFVARALEAGEHDLVDLAELPTALAATVTRLFTRATDARVHERARRWIASRASEPEVSRALDAVGLTTDDFSGRAS